MFTMADTLPVCLQQCDTVRLSEGGQRPHVLMPVSISGKLHHQSMGIGGGWERCCDKRRDRRLHLALTSHTTQKHEQPCFSHNSLKLETTAQLSGGQVIHAGCPQTEGSRWHIHATTSHAPTAPSGLACLPMPPPGRLPMIHLLPSPGNEGAAAAAAYLPRASPAMPASSGGHLPYQVQPDYHCCYRYCYHCC